MKFANAGIFGATAMAGMALVRAIGVKQPPTTLYDVASLGLAGSRLNRLLADKPMLRPLLAHPRALAIGAGVFLVLARIGAPRATKALLSMLATAELSQIVKGGFDGIPET
jgi:hypothetical protein